MDEERKEDQDVSETTFLLIIVGLGAFGLGLCIGAVIG